VNRPYWLSILYVTVVLAFPIGGAAAAAALTARQLGLKGAGYWAFSIGGGTLLLVLVFAVAIAYLRKGPWSEDDGE
jgi:hypothetical protein